MSRLVEARPLGGRLTTDGDGSAVKDALVRVGKYVPGEVLVAYLAMLPVIASTTSEGETVRAALEAVAFVSCAVITPLYFSRVAKKDEPKRLQMVVSTFAFIAWAYYQGGIFKTIGVFHLGAATVLIVIFALVAAFAIPTKGAR